MNWKNYVATQNAKAFVLPPGWDSRETIAEQLECAPERVREHLQPGIAAREIEVRQFPVWDAELGRKIVVTAYRKSGRLEQATPDHGILKAARPNRWSAEDIKTAKKLLAEGETYRAIGKAIGRSRDAVKCWAMKHT
jgi:hypothetical protein